MASPRINQHIHTDAGVVLAAEIYGFSLFENQEHDTKANFFLQGNVLYSAKVNRRKRLVLAFWNKKTTDMKYLTRFGTLPALASHSILHTIESFN